MPKKELSRMQEMRQRSELAVIFQEQRGSDGEFTGFLAPPKGGGFEFLEDRARSSLTNARTKRAERSGPRPWSEATRPRRVEGLRCTSKER